MQFVIRITSFICFLLINIATSTKKPNIFVIIADDVVSLNYFIYCIYLLYIHSWEIRKCTMSRSVNQKWYWNEVSSFIQLNFIYIFLNGELLKSVVRRVVFCRWHNISLRGHCQTEKNKGLAQNSKSENESDSGSKVESNKRDTCSNKGNCV